MPRAFVTGGSGFVGRNLIRRLVDQGYEVVALARSESAAAAVRAAGATPVMGDLDHAEALTTGMGGCDVVFHAAAHLGEWGDEANAYRVNVDGTRHVIAAALAAGVPRLVHVSTEAVLTGDAPIVNVDETRPRSPHPMGVYPRTKAEAEAVVLAANSEALAAIVVRPRFIWGAGDTSLLPKLVEGVTSGRFMWFDGGRYLTSTCHVANVCEGLQLAAERGRGGDIYFLTDGEPVVFRDFLSAVLATQGLKAKDASIPTWAADALATAMEAAWTVFRLPGAPPLTRTAVALIGREVTVNDAKARRELGYQGHMSREGGLAEMAAGRETAPKPSV